MSTQKANNNQKKLKQNTEVKNNNSVKKKDEENKKVQSKVESTTKKIDMNSSVDKVMKDIIQRFDAVLEYKKDMEQVYNLLRSGEIKVVRYNKPEHYFILRNSKTVFSKGFNTASIFAQTAFILGKYGSKLTNTIFGYYFEVPQTFKDPAFGVFLQNSNINSLSGFEKKTMNAGLYLSIKLKQDFKINVGWLAPGASLLNEIFEDYGVSNTFYTRVGTIDKGHVKFFNKSDFTLLIQLVPRKKQKATIAGISLFDRKLFKGFKDLHRFLAAIIIAENGMFKVKGADRYGLHFVNPKKHLEGIKRIIVKELPDARLNTIKSSTKSGDKKVEKPAQNINQNNTIHHKQGPIPSYIRKLKKNK